MSQNSMNVWRCPSGSHLDLRSTRPPRRRRRQGVGVPLVFARLQLPVSVTRAHGQLLIGRSPRRGRFETFIAPPLMSPEDSFIPGRECPLPATLGPIHVDVRPL
jgi:hypothetical protein